MPVWVHRSFVVRVVPRGARGASETADCELIIATQKAYPLSVALANFSGGSDGIIYNAIALVAFLAFFPVLLLVILIQNHLSRGLTMGAVKG